MAKHRITVKPSQPLEVANSDLRVAVTSDDAKLGELRLSRGTIDWVPKNYSTGVSMTWEQFDRMMRERM